MVYTGSVEIRNNLRLHTHNGMLPGAGTSLFTVLGITSRLYDEMSWFDIVFSSSVEGILSVVRSFESTDNTATVNGSKIQSYTFTNAGQFNVKCTVTDASHNELRSIEKYKYVTVLAV